jgi:hypothetical protein
MEEPMDNTSWPEAIIASSAIISAFSFAAVLVWQISRIIQTNLTLGKRRGSRTEPATSIVD